MLLKNMGLCEGFATVRDVWRLDILWFVHPHVAPGGRGSGQVDLADDDGCSLCEHGREGACIGLGLQEYKVDGT